MKRLIVLLLGTLALSAACTGSEGPAGPSGASCAVVDNGDGTKTVTCPGSAPVTIANGTPGADGTDCTVVDNGDGTKTISCTDGTDVTVSNGAPCAVVDNPNGTVTITCPGSAPVTVADGTSCSVLDNHDGTSILSCTDGTRVLVAPPLDTTLAASEELPGVVLTIAPLGGHSNVDGSFHAGDRIGMTFTVKTAAGRIIPINELTSAGVWAAGPNSNYQHILPAARDAATYTNLITLATLNDDGSYTYLFPDVIPASFGVPLYDTTRYTDGELTGALTAGTYTLGLVAAKDYTIDGAVTPDSAATALDFRLDVAALATRAVVTTDNCTGCHKSLRAHGDKYRTVPLCVTCHTAGAEDRDSTATGDTTPNTIEFKVMIHKLHNGFHLPSVQGVTVDASGNKVYAATGTPYLIGDADFSAVLYPVFPNFNISVGKDSGYSALSSTNKTKENNLLRGVTDCAQCHGDPDGAGPLPAPAQGGDAFAAPSKRACGSCHDDLDYARPYISNGSTMPANTTEATCATCHGAATLTASHQHPLTVPAIAPETTINLTGLTGGTGAGGKFLAGDPLSLVFTIKDAVNADVPINYLDAMTTDLVGPTQNRQVVVPGQPGSPIDFGGRLMSAVTTNKGAMTKIHTGGTLVSETVLVNFTAATTFDVVGTTTGALVTGGTLAATISTNPTGSSIGNVVLTNAAVAQTITVAFTGATTYTVTGSVSGVMGSGTLPSSLSNTQRFTSTDGTVAFNVVVGTTAAAAGNTFHLNVVKGAAANPVLFAIVVGKTGFAATDRFYYDLIAPAASYTLKLPMDLHLEYLGDGDGTAGQVFTAGNLPVWYGRQTVMERTASPGTVATTTAAATMMGRYLYVTAIDAGLAANDYIVIDDGTGTEEYARIGTISTADAAAKRIPLTSGGGSTGYSSPSLRYNHAAGATVQEVTFTFRQEGVGNAYLLTPATGVITLAAPATVGNAFVVSYRTDARFGWKRKLGDTLAPFYYNNLFDDAVLDETWGDWRGKPIIDGTYTASAWGYRSIEHRSGSAVGGFEWQTYRAVSKPATRDFLYGATATTVSPYAKVPNATAQCNTCHGDLAFHGGSRRGAETCLQCHATSGPEVSFRTLAHDFHADFLPVMPNGAGDCATCHGATVVFEPSARNHPTTQSRPTRDWSLACTSCHSSPIAAAHAETMTATSSGVESCATCHAPGRDLAVELMHRAR